MDHFRNQLSGMTSDDIQSLFIVPSEPLLNDLGLNRQSLDTRQKLLASIPVHDKDQAKRIWERIHIDTSNWRESKKKADFFKTIQQAVWEDKKLEIVYKRADGGRSERIVEPLGLVAMGEKWYLAASTDGGMRNYRVSRIELAKIKNETFDRPDAFNLAVYWDQSKADFIQSLPEFQVEVTRKLSTKFISPVGLSEWFVRIIPVMNGFPPFWFFITSRKRSNIY
ncbi:helix-turn-helix transcriptional regulator [Paludifilum halophilum]|uniref:helix-turn-helix transcriptional regulator n=1 Tax=Paludifilum halophilum TaxID=1642702 RepID=UPI003084085C